jgi:hypothetical protein
VVSERGRSVWKGGVLLRSSPVVAKCSPIAAKNGPNKASKGEKHGGCSLAMTSDLPFPKRGFPFISPDWFSGILHT